MINELHVLMTSSTFQNKKLKTLRKHTKIVDDVLMRFAGKSICCVEVLVEIRETLLVICKSSTVISLLVSSYPALRSSLLTNLFLNVNEVTFETADVTTSHHLSSNKIVGIFEHFSLELRIGHCNCQIA